MQKLSNKILSFFLILFSLISCSSTSSMTFNNESYALFIYMCGGDLEENVGAASEVINEILAIEKSDNIEIYLETGGAKTWSNENISTLVSRFKVENELILLDSYKANMGEMSTLKDFVSFSKDIKADKKVLLFWGHGSTYSLCIDSLYEDYLTYEEIHEALEDSFYDLLIFNACYTSNLDLLTSVSTSADYAIASEHVFPSLGYSYTSMINYFINNNSKRIEEIGVKIIDDTLRKYENSSLKDTLTLSLIDLSALNDVRESFDQYFASLLYNSSLEEFTDFLKGVSNTNNVGSFGKDIFDLFSETSSGDFLKNKLKEAIVHEIHGTRFDTSGLSIFYKDELLANDINNYSSSCFYPEYLSFLKHRNDLKNKNYINILNTSRGEVDQIIKVTLDELAPTYAAIFEYVFYDNDKKVIKSDKVSLNSIFDDSSKNTIISVDNSALFELTLGDYLLNYSITSFQDDTDPYTAKITYKTNVEVNDVEGNLYFSYEYAIDDELNGVYEIIGFVPILEENEQYMESLNYGDVINIDNHDMVYKGENIKRSEIKKANYVSINVNDIFGKEYSSSLIRLK